jgi:hypothetical protein
LSCTQRDLGYCFGCIPVQMSLPDVTAKRVRMTFFVDKPVLDKMLARADSGKADGDRAPNLRRQMAMVWVPSPPPPPTPPPPTPHTHPRRRRCSCGPCPSVLLTVFVSLCNTRQAVLPLCCRMGVSVPVPVPADQHEVDRQGGPFRCRLRPCAKDRVRWLWHVVFVCVAPPCLTCLPALFPVVELLTRRTSFALCFFLSITMRDTAKRMPGYVPRQHQRFLAHVPLVSFPYPPTPPFLTPCKGPNTTFGSVCVHISPSAWFQPLTWIVRH